MKITIESTDKIVHLNDVPARIWEGTSESGVKLHVYITRVAVNEGQNTSEFEKELQSHRPPSQEIEAIPLRMIL